MTTGRILEPTPALVLTVRCAPDAVESTVVDALAALRETAKQLGLVATGEPMLVAHDEDGIVEVALPIEDLPETDPPPPVAAEVLTPGTLVGRAEAG